MSEPFTLNNGDLEDEIEIVEGALELIRQAANVAEQRGDFELSSGMATSGLRKVDRLLDLYREFYRRHRIGDEAS